MKKISHPLILIKQNRYSKRRRGEIEVLDGHLGGEKMRVKRLINVFLLLFSIIPCIICAEEEKAIIYITKPITNIKILPASTDIPGKVSDVISVVACPGEYEPASFVVHALSDINSLKVEATDLKRERRKSIPSSNIDIKGVKCWYQSTSALCHKLVSLYC